MPASAEATKPLTVSQPQSPFEADFEIPAHFVNRYFEVMRIASEERVPQPHLVAAIVAQDTGDIPHRDLAVRTHALELADQYLRENSCAPFMHVNRIGLEAGITDSNYGLTVMDWSSTIDYGTGLMVASQARLEVDFSGKSVEDINCEVPTDKPVKFITPETFVTSANFEEVDLEERVRQGGVLAVGEEAVNGLQETIADKKIRNFVAYVIEIAQTTA